MSLLGKINSSGRILKLLQSSVYSGYKSNLEEINLENFMGELNVENTTADFKTEYRLAKLTPYQEVICHAADSFKNNACFQNTTRVVAILFSG